MMREKKLLTLALASVVAIAAAPQCRAATPEKACVVIKGTVDNVIGVIPVPQDWKVADCSGVLGVIGNGQRDYRAACITNSNATQWGRDSNAALPSPNTCGW